jgi:hypothetical protein
MRPALPHENLTGIDILAAKTLHAQTLRVRIATVTG